MPRKSKLKIDSSRLFDVNVCAFCGISDDDDVLYGEYITSNKINMHSSCMFFASNLAQTGRKETDGFYGFLLPDIERELLRGKKLMCSYCHKKGATVGCNEIKCKKCYHLPCGIKSGSLQQFFGQFRSYCKDHKPQQKHITYSKGMICHICCEELSPESFGSCLYAPCCKNSWFHKICLQKYAVSAGSYFFKCPLCNNSKKFLKEMEIYGIRIPKRDASWELEENAYQELLHRPECDLDICLCSKGRKFSSEENSEWTLLSCSLCGSHARHIACAKLNLCTESWICEECDTFERKSENKNLEFSEDLENDTNIVSATLEVPLTSHVSEIFEPAELTEGNAVVDMKDATLKQAVGKIKMSQNIVDPSVCILLADMKDFFDKNLTAQNPSTSHTNALASLSYIHKKDDEIKYSNITTDVEMGLDENAKIMEDKFIESSETAADDLGIENSSKNKRLKTTLQDMHEKNLSNITNITDKPTAGSIATVKNVLKKPKNLKPVHVCHNSKLCCIKKYFSNGPFQFRV